ncbi:uncharacterized protein [Clytia hemisphaerica]
MLTYKTLPDEERTLYAGLMQNNGLSQAVGFSANKICYIYKIGQEGYTMERCSEEISKHYLCRYFFTIPPVPASSLFFGPNNEYEQITQQSDGGVYPDTFLSAKKSCEAKGKEVLSIENLAKFESFFDLFAEAGAFLPTLWLGMTYDPFDKKFRYCNKEIQSTFRPWCSNTNDFDDEGRLCVVLDFISGCFRQVYCGLSTPSIICQHQFSPLSTYVRVAQNLINEIKSDCKSCKKN